MKVELEGICKNLMSSCSLVVGGGDGDGAGGDGGGDGDRGGGVDGGGGCGRGDDVRSQLFMRFKFLYELGCLLLLPYLMPLGTLLYDPEASVLGRYLNIHSLGFLLEDVI